MRRPSILVPLVAFAFSSLLGSPVAAQERPTGALVVMLPTDQARVLAARRPMALGWGVYPPTRDARGFIGSLAFGEPGTDDGLVPVAAREGVGLGIGVAGGSEDQPPGVAAAIFGEPGSIADALEQPIAVVAVALADDAEALLRLEQRAAVIIGTDGRTPLLVGSLDVPFEGLLTHGVARRTGAVAPVDLAATIMVAAGLPPVARPPIVEPTGRALEVLDRLAARWEDDVGFPQPLTQTTVALGLFAVVFGSLALLANRHAIARALALAAAAAPAGYVAAMFLRGAPWQTRGALVVAAAAVGAGLSVVNARRAAAWIVASTTLALAALTIVAASAPDGEVAMGLWGDPLVSWRFFGLRNHLAMFLTGGFVAAAMLLALPSWLVVTGGVVIGAIVGAAVLGANFVAVAVLGFAIALVVLARAGGRPRFLHLPFAAVAGVLASLAALLADAGSPVSHGGRAVQGVRSGGFEAAWDILVRRARLNYEEITAFGIAGVIGFVLAAFALALLFWWALREDDADPSVRAGVGGLAAAALVTLVAEDSGFYVGSILGLYPWILFILDRAARRLTPPLRPASGATSST